MTTIPNNIFCLQLLKHTCSRRKSYFALERISNDRDRHEIAGKVWDIKYVIEMKVRQSIDCSLFKNRVKEPSTILTLSLPD